MITTHFACGCVSIDGARNPKDCTEAHTAETTAPGHTPIRSADHDAPKKAAEHPKAAAKKK